jgi:hypothetical protein
MLTLKCPSCNSELELEIAFSGCDWETVAGEGSGYKYPMALKCISDRCVYVFTLGYVNDAHCFSPAINKPYARANGFMVNYLIKNSK